MKKCLFSILTLIILNAYAADNALFQQFDNQVSFGLAYDNINAYNPSSSQSQENTQTSAINLGVEELFDNNVWLNLNGEFVFKVGQSSNIPYNQNIQEFGFPASLSGKIGYSFNNSAWGLQVTPYVTTGRILNYAGVAVAQNGFVNSYYNLFGGGARIEYIFVPEASLYFDQGIGYLQDPTGNQLNLSAMSYTSALGIRYNPMSTLQLALQGNFNYTYLLNQSVGYDTANLLYQNTTQTAWGGMFSIAYLFDGKNAGNNLQFPEAGDNSSFAEFDNSYLLGMGFATSTNSYSGGNQAAVGSSLNYYTIEFTHLFQNGVWANINGQLINNIVQNNTPSGRSSSATPTYLGFPGNAAANVGYAFPFENIGLQVTPYANLALVSSINSYNVKQTNNLTSAIAQDKYYQYGLGGRLEYNMNKYTQVYIDQLFAIMNDQSPLGLNTWASTSKIGTKINPFGSFQIGIDGFYNAIIPTGSTYNPAANINYAANQNTLGVEIGLGFHY